MHFNIYIDNQIGAQLTQIAKRSDKSRNAIIREAINEWVQHHLKPEWPEEILNFKGVKDFPPLESYRNHLIPPKDDPLS